MNRRTFLRAIGAGSLVGLAGCSGEKHPVAIDQSVTIEPGSFYNTKFVVPGVSYNLAYKISPLTEAKYDVFVFDVSDSNDPFELYKQHVNGDNPDEYPDASDSLSDAHVDGGTEHLKLPISKGEYQFVIDYSDFKGKSGNHGHDAGENPLEAKLTLDVTKQGIPFFN